MTSLETTVSNAPVNCIPQIQTYGRVIFTMAGTSLEVRPGGAGPSPRYFQGPLLFADSAGISAQVGSPGAQEGIYSGHLN